MNGHGSVCPAIQGFTPASAELPQHVIACDYPRWSPSCRLGYHVTTMPDHLRMPSPFPAYVLAAAALEDYSRFLRGTLSPKEVGELPGC
jgi:hypothetical protein